MTRIYKYIRDFVSNGNRAYIVITALLFAAWIMPGLVGHDPWKADEPYSFGLVNHILKTGDLVVPTLAGEPFMEKPPLFYITAAGFAKVFSPILPLHDGARLASGVYVLLALLFTGLSARELFGGRAGIAAVLIMMSCIGLPAHAHKLITDNALLAGFAIAMYGIALIGRRFVLGGILTGTGVGIGFMAKGLLAPGIMAIVIIFLPILFRDWRDRRRLYSIAIAFAAAVPWCMAWPLALYGRSPALFFEWLWTQNFGRFMGANHLGPPNKAGLYLYTLPWFAWPAIPVALWALWYERKSIMKSDSFRLPLLIFLVMLTILTLSSDGRDLYALPMLAPLSAIAASKADLIPPAFSRLMSTLGILCCSISAVLLWAGWVVMLTGFPVSVSERLHSVSPAYKPSFSLFLFATAAIYSILWLLLLKFKFMRSWTVAWVAGVTLVWGLMMTLWLPWSEACRSYRPMVYEMKSYIPSNAACISSIGVGESERAMLEYFGGILTQRKEVCKNTDCDLLIVTGNKSFQSDNNPGVAWTKIWEGHRAGEEKMIFSLYRRIIVNSRNIQNK